MELLMNGKTVSEPNFSENIFLNGINIYEVVRIYEGFPIGFNDNMERLHNSMARSGVSMDINLEKLPQQIRFFMDTYQMRNGNLKIVYHIENNHFNQYIYQIPCQFPTAKDYAEGVATLSMHAIRRNPQIKYVNLSLREEADRIINRTGVYETILINEDGCITEGSRSNLFFLDDTALYSAPFGDILPGTTRKRVAEICEEHHIPIIERPLPYSTIDQYDACCITSTGPLVLPVNRIDQHRFNPQNALLQRLVKLYFEKIRTNLRDFPI